MSGPIRDPQTRATARSRLRRLLRLRDLRLLWIGMTVSLIGDGVFLVALAWQVYQLSNAPTALAAVGLAMTIPQILFILVGGVISDRLDRRAVMIAADAIRCGAIGAIGLLSMTGELRLWHLSLLGATYGIGTAFFAPAFDAIIPELVDPSALTDANSLEQFVRPSTLRLVGPAIGGLVIGAWGLGVAFVLDAGTYLASIAALMTMSRRVVRDVPPAASILAELREGLTYVRSHVWLWGTLLAASLAYLLFMGPVEVLVPYIVKNDLRSGAGTLGFVFAMGGLGAIGGALLAARNGMPRRPIRFMYLSWTAATLAVAMYGLSRMPWQAMAASFLFNALETVGTVVWATTKQRRVPIRLLGRVSSLDWFVSIGLLPLSFALTGPVAQALGARTTLLWAGVLGAAVTIAPLLLPGMRAAEGEGSAAMRKEATTGSAGQEHRRQSLAPPSPSASFAPSAASPPSDPVASAAAAVGDRA